MAFINKVNDAIRRIHIKLLMLKQHCGRKNRGQTTIEYIVGSAVLILLIFGMYKLLQSKNVLEGVFNWFKKTFTAGAKDYKK